MEKKWKSSNLLPQFSLKTASLVGFAALSSYYWLNIHCTFMNVIVITYQSQTHTQKKNEAQSCSATVSTSDPRQKQTVSSVYNSLLCMCVFITCTQELLFRGEREIQYILSALPFITQTDSSLLTCCRQPLFLSASHAKKITLPQRTQRSVEGRQGT